MPSRFQRILARIAWAVPILLLALGVDQAKVALDLRTTLSEGTEAVARVTEYERVDRADVTYGYVRVEVPLRDGSLLSRDKLSLPYSLIQEIEGRDTLRVHVLPDGEQTIVIDEVVDTQWKIASIQSGISFLTALMALAGVIGWNRSLRTADDRDDIKP